nr:reverse transcriptase domain-containing protein [Tanacetum cinerariifolium]
MHKVCRNRRKDVHTRLDFGEGPKERTREDFHHSSARARTTKPEREKVQDRLRYGDRHVLDRLGHRRQSAFDRLTKTYSPSTTKSRPRRTDSRDPPQGRGRPYGLDTSKEDRPKDKERFRSVGKSYDDSFSYSYRNGNRSHHMNRRRDNESPISSVSRSDSSDGRYQRSRSKRHKSTDEDDLTKPWMCKEEDPFTPRIHNFKSSQRTRMPNNVKKYDGTEDPEDHVKIFQAAAHVERWAMPTWCHMFNSTLIGAARVWFDELPPESIESYKDLKVAFLAYFMQQKKYVKDPVEIQNIKQKDGEPIEDFIKRFKVETRRMKGAPECMRISGFMHGVNNPELTKRLNEHVPKTMEEMMITTTAFIRGEAAASKKKGHPPTPMVMPVEKRSSNKFCDFHNDKGHNTDECMQLKKQIEELVRAGKLSHLIKEIKHGRDQSKTRNKETTTKDKPMAIYMIQSWQRTTRQKVTQSFERVKEIKFPPLAANSGTEGPLVLKAEIGKHMIHRMYVDDGFSVEILYEHYFNRLWPEIKSQMVPATTSLTGFSGETIWPLGQLRLLVIIGDANHSTREWMNFMMVRSLSPYNGIIGRPGIRAIQAVPSTVHGMLKFPVEGGIVTIRSTMLIPTKCTSVITSSVVSKEEWTRPDNFKVALHPDFPDQEVAIGGTLSNKGRTELCSTLKKNLDIFAWQPSDMTGVPQSVAEHCLNIWEGYSPVRQKNRGQALEHAKDIQAEVQKLVEAGIMREVYYHNWLSNPIMVNKHDGSWWMYVDFTDLNMACPQDCYPMSKIDWKVESLYGYSFKCFLDAYKGYHQIQLVDTDEEKTTFHTGQGVRNVLGICSHPRGDKTVSGQNSSCAIATVTADNQRGPEPQWEVGRTAAKIEYHARRAQYYVHAKNVGQWTDGLSCVDGSGVGLILTNPEGIEFTYALRFQFAASNNEAEYEALIAGLQIAARMGVKNIHVSVDSKLVANQVLGTYVAKEDNMVKYLDKVKSLVLVEVLKERSIKEKEVVTVVEEDRPTWMTPIVEYLKERTLLGDKKEARKLRLKARQYKVMEGILYMRSFLTPQLRCVGPLQAEYVIREIHEGSCSMHAGLRTEVVIPTEIKMPTYCTAAVDVVSNDEELRLNLDLLEERRERAVICEAKAKSKMTKYYNARVHDITFRPGDFVYRINDASHAVAGGKLGPKWEGPYEVTEALGDGAYKLRSMDGTILPRMWNIANLK